MAAFETRSRRSSGEWLFQLTTITVGVLIALSFDAVLRWNSDRLLVAEARQQISQEIADNRGHVDRHLAQLPRRAEQLGVVLGLIDELLAEREPSINEFELGLALPELTSAAWETAERTGALALMDYGDVKRLALLYGFQELFVGQMQGMLEPLTKLEAYFHSDLPTNRDDLEAARALIMDVRGRLSLHEQLARQISKAYANYETASGGAGSSP